MNKVDVIICTYDRCESLKTTLNSLLAQECNGDFEYEVIVVDNNSKDKTKETVDSYISKFNGRLKYLFEQKQGVHYARNKGIEGAEGEIIAFTDDDVIVDKNWIKNINEVFKINKIDLLGGKVIPFFTTKIPKWLNNYSVSNLKYPLMFYDLGDMYLDNTDFRKILPIGCNMAARKEAYYKYGKYIESGRAQDIELSNRWHTLGAKIAYSPNITAYHYTQPSRITKKYFLKYFFQTGKDHLSIFPEQYNKGKTFLGIPLWLVKELMQTILSFLKGVFLFDKTIFTKELLIWHKIGIIIGLKKIKVGFNESSLR